MGKTHFLSLVIQIFWGFKILLDVISFGSSIFMCFLREALSNFYIFGVSIISPTACANSGIINLNSPNRSPLHPSPSNFLVCLIYLRK